MESILELLDLSELATMVVSFVPKAGAALVVFVAAWVLLKMTQPPIRGALRRADFAETLIRLLVSDLYRFVVLGFGLVMAAGQLGIDIGAALAGIGVVGVAVGFAAQESVANHHRGVPDLLGQTLRDWSVHHDRRQLWGGRGHHHAHHEDSHSQQHLSRGAQ